MGSIFKPDDKTRSRMMERALEDIDPKIRDAVKRLMEDYRDEDLDKKLKDLIGLKKTTGLLKKIKYTGTRGNGAERKSFWTSKMVNDLEKIYRKRCKDIIATYQVFFCRGVK